MSELPAVTPEYFQILVVRELRKVGFDVGTVRTHRRSELPEPEQGFVVELFVPLSRAGANWRALVACRHQTHAVENDVIDCPAPVALQQKVLDRRVPLAAAGDSRPHARERAGD